MRRGQTLCRGTPYKLRCHGLVGQAVSGTRRTRLGGPSRGTRDNRISAGPLRGVHYFTTYLPRDSLVKRSSLISAWLTMPRKLALVLS